jgi:peptidoglycan L-alanyl-D-glutamate endopeptidase CwlK
MDAISEARLKDVHPLLAQRIRDIANELGRQDIYIRVVQGLRTVKEQDALYAEGRTLPGEIVTNCPGGHSYHNYGLAVDVMPSLFGPSQPFEPDKNRNSHAYKLLIEAARREGLNCGADWRTFKDYPHFQLTGVLPVGHPPESALAAFQRWGMAGVWKLAGIMA